MMRRPFISAGLRWVWLLLALSAAAVYPALTQNIATFAYDAGTVHLYRSFVFSGAISDGAIYPRWVQFLHWGLGSPLFTFNPPLPYYALDLLYRLGLPHPMGWRILISAGFILAATGAFSLVYLLTGRRWPALLAAITYLYAPYVLRNALERGSLEVFSMFLYPWVLWGLLWLARRPSPARFVLATLLWAACIACHVLAPLMLAPLALALAVVAGWRHRTAAPLLALLGGILLTAAIWAPILTEQGWVRLDRNFVNNSQASPLKHPLSLDQLLAFPAFYDIARDNNSTGYSTGILQFVLLLVGIPATAYAWVRGRRRLAVWLGAATAVGLILFWMLTSASDPIWRLFEPILTRLEFRWRWMGLWALAAATVAGLSLALLPARWQRIAGTALALLMILAAIPGLYVELQHRYASFGDQLTWAEVRTAEIRTGGSAFTSWNEFAPQWRRAPFDGALLAELGANFAAADHPLAGPASGLAVESAQVLSSAWNIAVEASTPATATLNLLYYPRWQAVLDGRRVPLSPAPNTGLVQVAIPEGSHNLALRYGLTATEAAGLAVSGLMLLSLLGLTGVAIWSQRRPRRQGEAQMPVGEQENRYAPPLWLLVGLTALLAFKLFYVDAHTTWFRCMSTANRVCGMQQTVDAAFQGAPRLRGYSVATPRLSPGGELVIRLAWETDQLSSPKLRSFVHVRNSQKGWPVNPSTGSEIWIQQDNETPAGLLAGEFLPGKIYLDEFRVPVPSNMPPGEYFLEVGWTNPDTGEQVDVQTETIRPPLKILWRSVLLPSVVVG